MNLTERIKKIEESDKYNKNKLEYESKISKLTNDIEKIKKLKKCSYEDWKLNKISKDEFVNYSKDYDFKIQNLNEQIEMFENKLKNSFKQIKEEQYWIEHFRRNKKIKVLSKDVIDELIECIYVHEGGNITIKFKYQDEYESMLNYINYEMEVS